MMLYLALVIVTISIDAMMCHAVKKRFNLKASLLLSLAWPMTLIFVICAINKANKALADD